jgi:Ca-activated chloride channel family protein
VKFLNIIRITLLGILFASLIGFFGFLAYMAINAENPEETASTAIPNPESVLKVLAGSELKDIEPMLEMIKSKTDVQLQMEYIGTLDGAEKLTSQPGLYDIAWFSHAKYLSLLQADKKLIQAQEKIGISPVIPAVKESLAKQWGWINNPEITWSQIAEKVKAGQLNYAMTDPTASNSGFSTVMSVQAAFSNKGDAITAQDVDAEKLKSFFSGHSLTAGSSAFLSESYLQDQAKLGGIFNYRVVLTIKNS